MAICVVRINHCQSLEYVRTLSYGRLALIESIHGHLAEPDTCVEMAKFSGCFIFLSPTPKKIGQGIHPSSGFRSAEAPLSQTNCLDELVEVFGSCGGFQLRPFASSRYSVDCDISQANDENDNL